MKKQFPFLHLTVLLLLLITCISFKDPIVYNATSLNGAWQLQGGPNTEVVIFTNGYFMVTRYDLANKTLLRTLGGTYNVQNNQLNLLQEFNSEDNSGVGSPFSLGINIESDKIVVDIGSEQQTWKRLDNGIAPLAGVWRSGGRMQEGKVAFNPLGARKTFKILSATRFQWTAMNTETKEFLGTGGGTYSFVNGKYTENIEFFSRDSSRVGRSLVFDGKIQDNNWHHSGLNSKGAPMSEIWGKVE